MNSDVVVEQPAASQPLHVRLYERDGCHLCAETGELLNSMRDEFNYSLDRINIDQNAALQQEMNEIVPVVTIGDGVDNSNRVTAPITREKLRSAFHQALRQT